MNFILLFKVFDETGSTIATSLLWVTFAIPAILVGPIGAATADMTDRKKIIVITNFLQALTILFYAFTHTISLFLLFGVAMAYSLFNQFYVPAELAALPTLVKKNQYARANGIFILTLQFSIVIGFGIAGVLSGLYGFTNSLFFVSGLMFLAFFVATFLPKMETSTTVPKQFEKLLVQFFEKIMEGYRYIRENNYILVALSILLGVHTMLLVLVVNLPLVATQLLNVSPNFIGVLIAIPGAVGAAMGAFIVPKVLKKGVRKVRVLEVAFLITTLSLFVLALAVPNINTSSRVLAGTISIFFAGFAFSTIIVPTQTFLQEVIPDSLRGRVFGNYWFLAAIVSLFPVIFAGTISELFGIRLLMLILALISLAGFVFIAKYGQKFIRSGFTLSN